MDESVLRWMAGGMMVMRLFDIGVCRLHALVSPERRPRFGYISVGNLSCVVWCARIFDTVVVERCRRRRLRWLWRAARRQRAKNVYCYIHTHTRDDIVFCVRRPGVPGEKMKPKMCARRVVWCITFDWNACTQKRVCESRRARALRVTPANIYSGVQFVC